jgi:hypothetical protein
MVSMLNLLKITLLKAPSLVMFCATGWTRKAYRLGRRNERAGVPILYYSFSCFTSKYYTSCNCTLGRKLHIPFSVIGFQGEEQKKLDVLSNDVFIKALVSSGRTVGNLIPACIFTGLNVYMHCEYMSGLFLVSLV